MLLLSPEIQGSAKLGEINQWANGYLMVSVWWLTSRMKYSELGFIESSSIF